MLFRKAMFKRFHDSGSRDRTRNESNADRLEGLWRESLGGETCPKTVPVASHGSETGNSVVTDEIVDFAALDIGRAVVPSAKAGDRNPRIRLPGQADGQARRQILWIGAHVKRGDRVTPDLPRRFRIPQALQKPCFLLGSENALLAVDPCGNSQCRRHRTVIDAGGCPPLKALPASSISSTSCGMNPGKLSLKKAWASARYVGSSDR